MAIISLVCCSGTKNYIDQSKSDNLYPAEINGKWGYINGNGEVVINPVYEGAFEFSDGRALVQLNGKWGYIDRDNNIVVDAVFEEARDFQSLSILQYGKIP